MGCDIHAYIEYFSKKEKALNNKCYVRSFSSRLEFGRDYNLFGLLAGVRSHRPPIIPNKGVPVSPEISYTVKTDFYMHVVDDTIFADKELSLCHGEHGKNFILKTQAQDLINRGLTQYVPQDPTKIYNPDYHSTTWLSADELARIRKYYLIDTIEYYSDISGQSKKELLEFIRNTDSNILLKYTFSEFENKELYACLSTMFALEIVDSDIETRFVCWFDS